VIGNNSINGERGKKYLGKLDRVSFIKVILPPLDKYVIFHPARMHSIFSITLSQIDLALKGTPNERPRYFIGKEDTMHPKVLAKQSTLLTLPTRTNSDLVRLISNQKQL
jgi:hypothetical protein